MEFSLIKKISKLSPLKLLASNFSSSLSTFGRGFRFTASIMATRVERIKATLENELQPSFLDIINESFMHNVPKESETHLKVRMKKKRQR